MPLIRGVNVGAPAATVVGAQRWRSQTPEVSGAESSLLPPVSSRDKSPGGSPQPLSWYEDDEHKTPPRQFSLTPPPGKSDALQLAIIQQRQREERDRLAHRRNDNGESSASSSGIPTLKPGTLKKRAYHRKGQRSKESVTRSRLPSVHKETQAVYQTSSKSSLRLPQTQRKVRRRKADNRMGGSSNSNGMQHSRSSASMRSQTKSRARRRSVVMNGGGGGLPRVQGTALRPNVAGSLSTGGDVHAAIQSTAGSMSSFITSGSKYASSLIGPVDEDETERSGDNIRVAVRMRPMSKQELETNRAVVDVDGNIVTMRDPDVVSSVDVLHRSKETQFAFDEVLSPQSSQQEAYMRSAGHVVKQVLDGINCTVFAYGATGSGKTYTMSGTPENPGIIVLLLQDLFQEIEARRTDFSCSLTAMYMEIYNEELRDLLSDQQMNCHLREDAQGGVQVAGVQEWIVEEAAEIFDILNEGALRRTTDSHDLNEASSRSHAILQVVVTRTPAVGAKADSLRGRELISKLSLIDLAGSERAKVSGTISNKKMLREGAKINRSLLSLANCINALAHKTKKGLYVPYRDSKLTRLLKDSLGGSSQPSKTVMIANITAASSRWDETRETLTYANRAKAIEVKQRATLSTDQRITISQYQQMVSELQTEVHSLKRVLSTHSGGIPRVAQARGPVGSDQLGDLAENQAEAVSTAAEDHSAVHTGEEPAAVPADTDDGLHADPPKAANLSAPVAAQAQQVRYSGPPPSGEELSHTIEALRKEITENFSERMETKQSLLELQQTNMLNEMQVVAFSKEMEQWNSQHGDDEKKAVPDRIHRITKQHDAILASVRDNNSMAKRLQRRLRDLDSNSAEVVQKVASLSAKLDEEKNSYGREVLKLTMDRCTFELGNMELVMQTQLQAKIIEKQRELLNQQQEALTKHGIDASPMWHTVSEHLPKLQ